jgi:hypothetical protein
VKLPQRLVLTFTREGVEARVFYRRADGPNPGTVRRRREVEQLAREGLSRTLRALNAGEVEDLGTSGFATREDILGLPLASSDSDTKMKGAQK